MKIFNKFKRWCRYYAGNLLTMSDQIVELKLLTAKVLINQANSRGVVKNIQEAEFKVFSQFGEDGILQYLIQQCNIPPVHHSFVEFGVENYQESNTRFLLMNNNWKGLIIDPKTSKIQSDKIFWRHELKASTAFVDKDNINQLISDAGLSGEIGLLSIDIDGNDYWVWQNIHIVRPIIVVTEYNSIFGPSHSVTIPYDKDFVRGTAHYSNLYWGCSLKALENLAKNKGYALVGSNSAGNNAFFVRKDYLKNLKELTSEEAYVESRFRESRDRKGNLTFLSGKKRMEAIHELPIYDTLQDKVIPLKTLFLATT